MRPAVPTAPAGSIDHVERTLVVVGDLPGGGGDEAVAWAASRGYPVVAEPFAGRTPGRPPCRTGRSCSPPPGGSTRTCPSASSSSGGSPSPDRWRRCSAGRGRVEVVTGSTTWPDPSHVASRVHPLAALHADAGADPVAPGDWSRSWHEAGRRLAEAVAAQGLPWPSGLAVAATVHDALPADGVLVVGSSNPVRDLDLATTGRTGDPHLGVRVHANRGLAGIDGVVSTAAGVALGLGRPTHALLGDLTFLHDANGLLLGPTSRAPTSRSSSSTTTAAASSPRSSTGRRSAPPRSSASSGRPPAPTSATSAGPTAWPTRSSPTARRSPPPSRVAPDGLRVVEVPLDRSTHRDAHAALRALAARTLDS